MEQWFKQTLPICKRLLVLSFSLLIYSSTYANVTGTTNPGSPLNPVNIGMSVSLTGENSEIGNAIQQGAKIYIDKINATKPLKGHQLQLVVMDNNYEPRRAIQTVRQLITNDNVIALMGNNGSAPAIAIVPVVDEAKVLLFGAFPGTGILYKMPPDRYIINLRLSYAAEVNLTIKGLIAAGFKPDEFAFFIQDDAFGSVIYQESLKALKAQGYATPQLLPYGRYSRNTVNVESAVVQLLNVAAKPPRVIILGGTPAPNAKFIKLVKKELPNVYFVGFSGLLEAKDLTQSEDGKVVMSQVTPYFKSSSLPAIKEYLEDLQRYGKNAQPNPISFQAYLTAKILVMGINKAITSNTLSREGLIDALESMHNVDIGIGREITFDKMHHQALDTIWPSVLKRGEFVPLQWIKMTK